MSKNLFPFVRIKREKINLPSGDFHESSAGEQIESGMI